MHRKGSQLGSPVSGMSYSNYHVQFKEPLLTFTRHDSQPDSGLETCSGEGGYVVYLCLLYSTLSYSLLKFKVR